MARPAKLQPQSGVSPNINLRIPESMLRRVDRCARRLGTVRSDIIRLAIEFYLSKPE